MTRASMMAQDEPSLEDRVRERAYQLWVEAGQQHGRADEFWFLAEQEIGGAGTGAAVVEADMDLGSGDMSEGADASLASDEGLGTPAAEKPKRTRKAPAKAGDKPAKAPARSKAAADSASLAASDGKPRRGRRPGATV